MAPRRALEGQPQTPCAGTLSYTPLSCHPHRAQNSYSYSTSLGSALTQNSKYWQHPAKLKSCRKVCCCTQQGYWFAPFLGKLTSCMAWDEGQFCPHLVGSASTTLNWRLFDLSSQVPVPLCCSVL